jgi:hypothetical protein
MSDIFISYAREDIETAKRLAMVLESFDWSVWWDPNLRAGEVWDEVIEEALKEARSIVVLWSRKSVKSHWVKAEAAKGRSSKKLVPIFIENVDPPFGYEDIHTDDLTKWTGKADDDSILKLIKDLSALLGTPKMMQSKKVAATGKVKTKEINETKLQYSAPWADSWTIDGWPIYRGYEIKPKANLWFAKLAGAVIVGAQLQEANLKGANLEGANLEGSNLKGADLTEANLEGANLEGANFSLANLTYTNFKDAKLNRVDFSTTYLTGTKFQGADLRGARLHKTNCSLAKFVGAKYDNTTSWHMTFEPWIYRAINVDRV